MPSAAEQLASSVNFGAIAKATEPKTVEWPGVWSLNPKTIPGNCFWNDLEH